ncbi:MAG TPA: CopD family protein [Aggregatilineales bacterium]|nr:CopD family protein [Aggregatilineales bacterium]
MTALNVSSDPILTLSYFLHFVATIVWLGGLTILTLLVWPEARSLVGRQEHGDVILELLDRVRKRFYPLTNLCLILLIVTGLYQMGKSPYYDGFLQITNAWTRAILLKHVAVLGMLIIGAAMQWGVLPALERASLLLRRGKESAANEMEKLRRRERSLLIVNCILGLLVLFFTALARAI